MRAGSSLRAGRLYLLEAPFLARNLETQDKRICRNVRRRAGRNDRRTRRTGCRPLQAAELPQRGALQGGPCKARHPRTRRICTTACPGAGQPAAFSPSAALHGQSGGAARGRAMGQRRHRLSKQDISQGRASLLSACAGHLQPLSLRHCPPEQGGGGSGFFYIYWRRPRESRTSSTRILAANT